MITNFVKHPVMYYYSHLFLRRKHFNELH